MENMICAVHGQPMQQRSGANGMFWSCPVLIGVGQPGANQRGYCAWKPQQARQAPQQPATAPQAAPAASGATATSPRLQSASTALMAAATFLSGSGATVADVLYAAGRFHHEFLKLAFMGEVPSMLPPGPPLGSQGDPRWAEQGGPVRQDPESLPF